VQRFALILGILLFLAFRCAADQEEISSLFPEDPPTLEILPSAEISFQTELRFRYVIQTSTNLISWADLPGTVDGDNRPVRRFFSAVSGAQSFYRLRRIINYFYLPSLYCGEVGIVITGAGLPSPQTLTFPLPGRFKFSSGAVSESGVVSEFARTDNTFSFRAGADAQADTPYLDGTVFLKFHSSTSGLFAIKNSEFGGTNYGTCITIPHDRAIGSPPNIGADLTGKKLALVYCPEGREEFAFTSPTHVSYGNGYSFGIYTYDAETGILNISFENGWRFKITIGQSIAGVLYSTTSGSQPQFNYATYLLH
jgi:hypothetical protein